MRALPYNWYYTDLLDVEYKRHILMAYLTDVQRHFKQTKLYPQLADLVAHFRNLMEFLEMKNEMENGFPKSLKSIDLQNFQMAFQHVVDNNELMQVLGEIVEGSLPLIRKSLDEGKEIYEFVESLLHMEPVGILPLYRSEGYLILSDGKESNLTVYSYEIKLFENHQTQYRAVSTSYLDTYRKSIVNTSENIKIDLIRKHRKLPNPATFFVHSELQFPIEETYLQVVKRKLQHLIQE